VHVRFLFTIHWPTVHCWTLKVSYLFICHSVPSPVTAVTKGAIQCAAPRKRERTNETFDSLTHKLRCMTRKYTSAARQNLRLTKKLESSPEEKICNMFGGTPMLASMLLCHHRHTVNGSTVKYNSNERIVCFVIYYSLGASGYSFLRKHVNLRLPGLSAIHKWLSSLTFSPGWNDNLVEVIKDRVDSMSCTEKECVLMWDEMSIKTMLEYDKFSDSLVGVKDLGNMDRALDLATHALIFMIRGLSADYVFPVAFFFSANAMKTNDLLRVVKLSILKLSDLGLNIKVTVCDQGTPNQAIFKELGVSKDRPYIESDGKKVYMVFDKFTW